MPEDEKHFNGVAGAFMDGVKKLQGHGVAAAEGLAGGFYEPADESQAVGLVARPFLPPLHGE